MKKRLKSLIVSGLVLLLTSCTFKDLGNFRIIGYNASEDIAKTKCTVNFHTNGGTPIESKVFDQETSIDLTKQVTTRGGHDFMYWCSTSDLLQKAGDSWYIPKGTNTLDFYAYWSYDIEAPYFFMGKYPSEHVFDNTITNELNKIEPSEEEGKYYDVIYNGKKYRKIQSENYNNTWQWFEFKYLEWNFYGSKSVENSFLVCDRIVGVKEMNINNDDSLENTTLYSWLNDTFKEETFTIDEQAGILENISLIDNANIIEIIKKYPFTNLDPKLIWTGMKENGKYLCYDTSTTILVPTDSLEKCGVIPQIKRFHSGERDYTTVSFDTLGGKKIDPINYAYPKGTNVTYKLPEAEYDQYFDGDYRVNHHFQHWVIKGESKSYYYYSTSMGDVTFVANYIETKILHECNIYYYVPSNTVNPNPNKIRPTQIIELVDASATGRQFQGWFLDNEYTKPVTRLENIYKIAINIYGKFENNKYHINYHLGEGGVNNPNNPTEYLYSDTEQYAFQLYPPTRDHYEFKYWSDSETGFHNLNSVLEFSGSIAEDVDVYAIWGAGKHKVTYHVDESNGESFIQNSSLTRSDVFYDSTTGDYWCYLEYYPEKYKTYGDIPFLGAQKDHYYFDGWLLNGELITRDTPIKFIDQTLVPHFTYATYGTYIYYDLLDGMYFDESTTVVTYIDEGVSSALSKPTTKDGHRYITYFHYSGSSNYEVNYSTAFTGETGQIKNIYVTYEILHTGYKGQHTNKCIYCDKDLGENCYSGDLSTVGNSIEFGFYPLEPIEINENDLPTGVDKPTKDNHEGWLLDEDHGGNELVSYAYFDCVEEDGTNPKNKEIKFRYLYYFEKNIFFKIQYGSPSWQVMSVDSDNNTANVQCTQLLDFSIFNDQEVRYYKDTKFDTTKYIDDYKYGTSFLRSYLNNNLLNALFTQEEQEMIKTTSYSSSQYSTTTNSSPTYTYIEEEKLEDKIYLQSYYSQFENKYTFPVITSNSTYDKGYAYIQLRYSGQFYNYYSPTIATRDVAYAKSNQTPYYLYLYLIESIPGGKYKNNLREYGYDKSYLLSPRLTISY